MSEIDLNKDNDFKRVTDLKSIKEVNGINDSSERLARFLKEKENSINVKEDETNHRDLKISELDRFHLDSKENNLNKKNLNKNNKVKDEVKTEIKTETSTEMNNMTYESEYRYSKEEVLDMLNELYDEIPSYVFNNLNLGVIMADEVMMHPDSREDKPLYTLGHYKYSRMGRQVVIYYGSFMKCFSYLDKEALKSRLRSTLRHELVHHMENQAREDHLEREDFYTHQEYLYNNPKELQGEKYEFY